jgi:hypothetical protein
MIEGLLELWVRHLGPAADAAWRSLVFWRTIALVLATLVVLAFLFHKRLRDLFLAPKRTAHDTDIFKRAENLLDEATLEDCFYCLGDYMYRAKHSAALSGYLSFMAKTGNQYLNRRIRKEAKGLHARLDALTDFFGAHFFVYPEKQESGPQRSYYLYPELRWRKRGEEGVDIFEQRQRELDDLVDRAASAFRSFRETIKKVLIV